MRMAAPKLFSRATANTSFMLTRAGASDLLTRILGLDMGMSAPNQAFVLLRNITKNGDAVRLLRMSLRFMCHLLWAEIVALKVQDGANICRPWRGGRYAK